MMSFYGLLIFWSASLSLFSNVAASGSLAQSMLRQQSPSGSRVAPGSGPTAQRRGDWPSGSSMCLWHPFRPFRPVPYMLCCMTPRRHSKGSCLPTCESTETEVSRTTTCKTSHLREGDKVPQCVWKQHTREEESPKHKTNWPDLNSRDIFDNKRVVIIGLPGAFTPVCTSWHLPSFESAYGDLVKEGIDAVYCITVNDSFVTSAWAKHLKINNVTIIPDGNACFTYGMGMLVRKSNMGLGCRSWRYAAVVDNGIIEKLFVEPCVQDDATSDPHTVSTVENVLSYLRSKGEKAVEETKSE